MGLRGEENISELRRREGIAASRTKAELTADKMIDRQLTRPYFPPPVRLQCSTLRETHFPRA
jgi:hypothetical protein